MNKRFSRIVSETKPHHPVTIQANIILAYHILYNHLMSIDLIERRIIEVERELCSEEVELDSMISSLNEKYKKEKKILK